MTSKEDFSLDALLKKKQTGEIKDYDLKERLKNPDTREQALHDIHMAEQAFRNREPSLREKFIKERTDRGILNAAQEIDESIKREVDARMGKRGAGEDEKSHPGYENKTFIYADTLYTKDNEYLIDKPAIFIKGLQYKKDPRQFRRDLHNCIYEKDHIFEVRNRKTGKSTAKMAIKREPGDALYERINVISEIQKRKIREKGQKKDLI
jgi:hypothetical protein